MGNESQSTIDVSPVRLRRSADNLSPSGSYWVCDVLKAAADEIERLRSHIASLDYIPLRYRDRPPGFEEARRKFCDTPHLCFEFGDHAPVCGPCDTAAVKAIYQDRSE